MEEKQSRSHTSQETVAERAQRLEKAESRKPRRLSGWNAFQRANMVGQSLSLPEFKEKVQELGSRWRGMTAKEREPFFLEAQVQQGNLDLLAETPLPPSSEQPHVEDATPEPEAWRNAKKKLSCRRLAVNKDLFNSHDLWTLPTQFGDRSFSLHSATLFASLCDPQCVKGLSD